VWTAPWQELADVGAESIGCGHVSGLSMRQVWLLALPQIGRRPQHHEQASTPTQARFALHPAADIERCVAGFCLSFHFRFSKNFLDGSVAESASDIRRHSATGNFQCQNPSRINLCADWIAVILASTARLLAINDRHRRSSP